LESKLKWGARGAKNNWERGRKREIATFFRDQGESGYGGKDSVELQSQQKVNPSGGNRKENHVFEGKKCNKRGKNCQEGMSFCKNGEVLIARKGLGSKIRRNHEEDIRRTGRFRRGSHPQKGRPAPLGRYKTNGDKPPTLKLGSGLSGKPKSAGEKGWGYLGWHITD